MPNYFPQCDPSKIRQARVSRRISMDRLAALAGVTKDAIYKMETGKTKSPYKLSYIAQALGVSVADLSIPEPEPETVATR